MKILLALCLVALTGCTALDNYERTYALSGDVQQQTVAASLTLKPVAKLPAGANPVPVTSDQELAKQILAALAAYRGAQVPAALPDGKAVVK